MNEETLKNIFEPFYTTSDKGTGLGMFIVNSVVSDYNGEILVKSEEGKGTEFTIYLPVYDKDELKKLFGKKRKKDKKLSKMIEEKVMGRKKNRVFLIDDEKIVTEMLQEFLSDEGFKVKAFNDSRKALKYFRKNSDKYDLIITDLTMPHLTGIELSKEIKNINSNVPIILLTGYKKELNNEMVKEYNIKQILLKPVNLEVLLKTLKSIG